MYFGSYTCITELILVLRNLYLCYRAYSCTFYIHIFSHLPRPGTMNEMDVVHQEPEGMVQY